MESNTEEVVVVSSDSEPQPITGKITRKKKQPASKEYIQDYYLKHKGAHVCEHCERVYTCKSSSVKHQGRSVKCYMERVKAVVQEIKQTPADDFDPELTLQKMEAIIYIYIYIVVSCFLRFL